jgi:hypothetical protein
MIISGMKMPNIKVQMSNQPIRLPGLILRLRSGQAPRVCLSINSRPRAQPRGSGLILSGAFHPDLKIGVWRRRTYQIQISNKGYSVLESSFEL